MDSDSSFYTTSYSVQERIEKELREERQLEKQRKEKRDAKRQSLFEYFFNSSELAVFHLRGLKFHTFRHLKLKFSFHPASVVKYVRNTVIFYVSLKYGDNYWSVRKSTLPVNMRCSVYKLFYEDELIIDNKVFSVIAKMYEMLVEWSEKHERFRLEKFQRYKNGDDVYLDSDDEALFLTPEERMRLYEKKTKILRRMIPPKPKKRRN